MVVCIEEKILVVGARTASSVQGVSPRSHVVSW
jgi:hypothetical protein